MQSTIITKVIITVAALVVAAAHIWVPNLKIDSITLCLLAVAVLPWLQSIFKTVKLPGGFEITLQELKEDVLNARGAAQSAQQKADLAVSEITADAPDATTKGSVSSLFEQMDNLAAAYETILAKQARGAIRTQAMTRIVREMIALAPLLKNIDILALLRSQRQGQRLAAYAYLYTLPNSEVLSALAFSVTNLESQPFGQYWGLQAIARTLELAPRIALPKAVLKDLSTMLERVPKGSDREYELKRLLAAFDVVDAE